MVAGYSGYGRPGPAPGTGIRTSFSPVTFQRFRQSSRTLSDVFALANRYRLSVDAGGLTDPGIRTAGFWKLFHCAGRSGAQGTSADGARRRGRRAAGGGHYPPLLAVEASQVIRTSSGPDHHRQPLARHHCRRHTGRLQRNTGNRDERPDAAHGSRRRSSKKPTASPSRHRSRPCGSWGVCSPVERFRKSTRSCNDFFEESVRELGDARCGYAESDTRGNPNFALLPGSQGPDGPRRMPCRTLAWRSSSSERYRAHRLRERREPAARARTDPSAEDRRASGAWREPLACGAPAARREPGLALAGGGLGLLLAFWGKDFLFAGALLHDTNRRRGA